MSHAADQNPQAWPWFARAALWVWQAAALALEGVVRRKIRRRARSESGYQVRLEERFGQYDAAPPAWAGARPLWVHAVSLGEMRTAQVLLRELAAQRGLEPHVQPPQALLVSCGTATGRAEAERWAQEVAQEGDWAVHVVWQPWDASHAVRAFFDTYQPRIGVLMETELWPTLVREAALRGVPVVLANARMSAESRVKSARLAWLSGPAFASLARVLPQTDAHAQHFLILGVSRAAMLGQPFGNLKFDAQPSSDLLRMGQRWRAVCQNGTAPAFASNSAAKPILMFAASREGEEAALLQSLKRFSYGESGFEPVKPAQAAAFLMANSQQNTPSKGPLNSHSWPFQLLIVPRHPQRFGEIAQLLEGAGLVVARRSDWGLDPPAADGCAVWLGDSMGEMPAYYALASLAMLGGSFAPLGGQNLIEAAACSCPVIMGPHTFNFAQAAEMAQASGAAQRVADFDAALGLAARLLRDLEALRSMRAHAERFSLDHRGSAAKQAAVIAQLTRN